MVQFQIQSDSDIPASIQLFNQIRFAIASRQYAPGHRLPSTRQLALITGLHRNTISKVYRQLEEIGLVEAQAGSGIYVRPLGHEGKTLINSPLLAQNPLCHKIVKQSLDDLLAQGVNLSCARELFLAEIDWRLRCSARILVTAGQQDMGVGQLMVQELEQALGIPVQLVSLEELNQVLDQTPSGTIVTSRYFIGAVEAIAADKSVRIIPVDIYDYSKEITLISQLPDQRCVGIVSLSSDILTIAQVIIHSLRGDSLSVMTAQANDSYKLNTLIRNAHVIICDQASYQNVHTALIACCDELIRKPQLIRTENYIGSKSINLLKRELGLG